MARSFNGVADHIDIGAPANLIITGKISFAAWIYVASAPTNNTQESILAYGGTSRNYVFDYRNVSGTLLLEASWTVSGSFAEERATQTLSTNAWNHVGFTNDPANNPYVAQWYVNGSAVTTTNSGAVTSGTPDNTPNLDVMISTVDGTAAPFNGRIADVGLWSGILLTAGEMSALAKGARPFQIRPTSMVGYWPLTGIQSPEPDFSGKKNNGTLSGTLNTTGPPIMQFTPRWPMGAILTAGAPAATTVFRRTLSPIGTRTGSRQVQGTP